MKDCEIRIVTLTGTEKSLFSAPAVGYAEDGGVLFRFVQDGESCALFLGRDFLSLERDSLSLLFRLHRKTEARLRAGGAEGVIPIFTTHYSISDGGPSLAGDFGVDLCYELRFPNAFQLFSLHISILF